MSDKIIKEQSIKKYMYMYLIINGFFSFVCHLTKNYE